MVCKYNITNNNYRLRIIKVQIKENKCLYITLFSIKINRILKKED